MPMIRYFTQKDQPEVMLPTRSHYVEAHGTIRARHGVMGKLNKKGRRAWREGIRQSIAAKIAAKQQGE